MGWVTPMGRMIEPLTPRESASVYSAPPVGSASFSECHQTWNPAMSSLSRRAGRIDCMLASLVSTRTEEASPSAIGIRRGRSRRLRPSEQRARSSPAIARLRPHVPSVPN
jgi:hypothetical protein